MVYRLRPARPSFLIDANFDQLVDVVVHVGHVLFPVFHHVPDLLPIGIFLAQAPGLEGLDPLGFLGRLLDGVRCQSFCVSRINLSAPC